MGRGVRLHGNGTERNKSVVLKGYSLSLFNQKLIIPAFWQLLFGANNHTPPPPQSNLTSLGDDERA